MYDDFIANLTVASLGTVSLANDWADDLAVELDAYPGFSPDDYDPPQYSDYADDGAENVTQAAKQHDAEGDSFLAKVR